ncbi:MAG: Kelch repeat-containing protein [Natronosporangium sp.]
MKKLWYAGLTATLGVALGGCTGDDPADPGTAPDGPSPTPRPQIGSWTPVAELPQPRTELSAVALDGLVYVAGGATQGPGAEVFFRYDPGSDSWTELAPLPDERHHAQLAAADGTVYLAGGVANRVFPNQAFLGSFSTTETLFAYDVATDTWREGPPLPGPVGAHAATATDRGTIHVLGGIGEEPIPARDDHLVFDPATGSWSTLPPMPSAREHLGAAYLDGVIYAAAGRGGGDSVAFEAYDIETQQWTVLPDVPTARSGVAVVAFQGQVYVFGGETLNGTFDHAERYDPASRTWQEVTPMPTARHGLGGAALADGIVLIGGGPQVGFSYTADTEIWRP